MEHETKTHSTSRGKGRGRGRGRKKTADNDVKVEEPTVDNDEKPFEQDIVTLDLDADITQFEAPTFSTINKGPPEPMLRLKWDHKTHLIGEKVINPMIHCCNKCEAPILIYGRMIPCKHVFCLSCAEQENKVCPRCQEKVIRIEKTGLGTVFMCTFGGTRYGSTGCRRTYLSQRDLLAHINHRHVVGITPNKDTLNNNQVTPSTKSTTMITSTRSKPSMTHHTAAAGDPRVQTNNNDYYKMHSSSSQHLRQQQPHQHSHISHHLERQQSASKSSSQFNIQHQHSVQHTQQLQRHIPVSASQKLLSSSDFVNQMIAPNYASQTPGAVTPLANVRSNLITIQIHDSNVDSSNATVGMNFPHQTYSTQFQLTSSSGIPFPVPPPGQPNINSVSQTAPQYFPSTPLTYSTSSSQRASVAQFSPNSQTQTVMSQSQLMPGPSMVPPPRRPAFPGDNVLQPFSIPPPPHRWHQPPPPNQTPFY